MQDIRDGISKHLVCEWTDVRFLERVYNCSDYTAWIALVNDCHMLVQHYELRE